jgi:hypothetical protein
MQSEELDAPWNDPIEEECKIVEVTISQTLSSTQKISVPVDFDETDKAALERAVNEQIILPSDCLEIDGYLEWVEDDFCVVL